MSGEHAAAQHRADEAGDERDRPHRGPPAGVGGRGASGAGSAPLAERRHLRRVAPEAVVGGERWDATGGVVVAVVVRRTWPKR